MWSRVRIGTNSVCGEPVARTAALVAGSRLLVLEESADGDLRVSAEIYDERGRRTAVLLSNRWQYEQSDLALEWTSDRLRLLDRHSSRLLDVAKVGQDLVISRLDVCTRDGHRGRLDETGRLSVGNLQRGLVSPISGRVIRASLQQLDLATVFAPSASDRLGR
jgi:hypothetical protein